MLIALAGICGRTIHSKGIKYVHGNLSNFSKDSDLMDSRGASDDYSLAQSHSKPIGKNLLTDYRIIEWSGFRWIFEYLMTTEVWEATKFIAEKLVTTKTQSLKGSEIEEVIVGSGLRDFLNQNRSTLLSKRYPLNKNSLVI